MQNSDYRARISSVYGSQTSPMVFSFKTMWLASELLFSMGASPHLWFLHAKQRLYDQNYKSLLVPDLDYVFFAFNTATLVPELQVSMGPSPHLWFCAFTTATLWPEWIVSLGPRPKLSLCARKTAWLAPELLVSMGLRTHLSFCACKTTWSIRITSLYGSQPSSGVFTHKTATFGSE